MSSRLFSSLRATGFGSAFLTLAGLAIVPSASADTLVVGQSGTSLVGTATISGLGTTASGTYQYNGGPIDPTRTSYASIEVYGPSTVNLSGGTVIDDLATLDTSTVHVSSGNVSHLVTGSASNAYITGGAFGLIQSFENSNLYVSGGNGQRIITEGTSTAHISGGSVSEIS